MTKPLPIDEPEFWRERLDRARSIHEDTIHTAIYDVSLEEWNRVQSIHAKILPRLLRDHKYPRVLDCGCGYGALVDILPMDIHYVGVDLSLDLLHEARD